jgi:hypothetical protein
MNPISKTHQAFSRRLNNPRVLTNPEEFLGPNYEEVLNFWLILDELSEEQWRVVKERYWAFRNENYSEHCNARNLAYYDSIEAIGKHYANNAFWAAVDATNSCAALWATLELIAMHKILKDHQKPLTFFQMSLDQLP